MHSRLSLCSIAIFFLGSAGSSKGCKCPAQTPQEFADRAETVFIGKTSNDKPTMLSGGRSRSSFVVLKVVKGKVPPKVEVEYDNQTDCSYSFDGGERYLVYAKYHNSPLLIEACSGTNRSRFASQDFPILELR